MANANDEQSQIRENLVDAGCDATMIKAFLVSLKHPQSARSVQLLQQHRRQLLTQLQKKVYQNNSLTLTTTWDKTFAQSNQVDHQKVPFPNRYGITLAADMYTPKNATGKLAAIAVSGPFGAVKEQAPGLYAQTMAERGFLTIAFDPSYTGESAGEPRNTASPDVNTEDFQAAVDFLSVQPNVDPGKVGIIGICSFGGMALNAAAIDTRIKATVTMTMYNMSRVNANDNEEARHEMKVQLNAKRTADYRNGIYKRTGGVVDPVPDNAPQFVRNYHAYYKTDRGYHKRSVNSNEGWNVTGAMSFINQPIHQRNSYFCVDGSRGQGALLLLQQG